MVVDEFNVLGKVLDLRLRNIKTATAFFKQVVPGRGINPIVGGAKLSPS